MDDVLYDYFLFYFGIVSFLVNVIVFVFIQVVQRYTKDPILSILKYSRLNDGLIPLYTGPILQLKLLLPTYGIIANGLCHKLKSFQFCNYAAVTALLMSYYSSMFVTLTYLLRYNIFVREKNPFYFNYHEKLRILISIIILPIVVWILAMDAPLKECEYEQNYSNIQKLLEPYKNTDNTVIIYSSDFRKPFIFIIALGVLYCIVHVIHGTIFYVIPLEKKLRGNLATTLKETHKILRRSIIQLRLLLLITVIFGMGPLFVSLFFATLSEYSNYAFMIISHRIIGLYHIYFTVTPIFSFTIALVSYIKRPVASNRIKYINYKRKSIK
uniref:G_PROTEIN_RECEP_F1_2 domain-containing protein n=1 Tax=Parastrongyloides trichosuri TaxID=131310 RepID=A0A0N4ZD44_PARTI